MQNSIEQKPVTSSSSLTARNPWFRSLKSKSQSDLANKSMSKSQASNNASSPSKKGSNYNPRYISNTSNNFRGPHYVSTRYYYPRVVKGESDNGEQRSSSPVARSKSPSIAVDELDLKDTRCVDSTEACVDQNDLDSEIVSSAVFDYQDDEDEHKVDQANERESEERYIDAEDGEYEVDSCDENAWEDNLNENQRQNDDLIDSLKRQIEFLGKQLNEMSESRDNNSETARLNDQTLNEIREKIDTISQMNQVSLY